jgi:spore coat protein CotH
MGKRNIKDYYCNVISETVKIKLKNRINIGLKYKGDSFVKCNQEDCQFVDRNTLPCPLVIEMFSIPCEV